MASRWLLASAQRRAMMAPAPSVVRAALFEEVAEFPSGLGAHAPAVISGHAIYVTLAWAALAMALAVAAAVPLARTVLAARRTP